MTVNDSILRNTSLSLLQATGSRIQTSSRNSSKQTDPLLAALEKSDPEKARALKEQKAQATQLLEQLQSSKTDLKQQKKEAARQKIEQIKAQIKALRLQVADDPKALARQAARLARELASAARDYAQGGGGDLSLPSAATTAPTQTAQTAATTDVSPDSAPPVAETAAASTGGQDAGTAADIQNAETQARETAGKESHNDISQDEDSKEGSDIKDEVTRKIAEAAHKSGESDADEKFAEETRRLLNELKAILKAAKDRLHASGDEGGKGDIEAAERAFRDIEKSLGTITGGTTTAISSSINILT
ncbi:MAG: hypothetical protein LRY54_00330 [Alphaproteobacteria bacterium]|nr:hypothetical protein [Alphaproteobacteria bacterium]